MVHDTMNGLMAFEEIIDAGAKVTKLQELYESTTDSALKQTYERELA